MRLDNMGDKAVVNPLPYVGCSAARQTPFDEVKLAHLPCVKNRGPATGAAN